MSDNVNPFGQPSGQSTQPTASTTPAPASPFDQPTVGKTGTVFDSPAPKKKGHGKLIAGVIGGVVAVAAIVVAVVLFMTMGKPSADDYEAAYDATIDLNNTISDVVTLILTMMMPLRMT